MGTVKAMYKTELAEKAGVSRATLMSWCKPYMKELGQLGMTCHTKLLPPQAVQFIAEKMCIDL